MPEQASLRLEDTAGVTVVEFQDASVLDALTIQRVGRDLYEIVEAQGKKRIVLDMAEVRFLSSQALGVLLTLRRKADKAGAKIVLARIRPELLRVFKITNLDKLFEFFDDRDAAVAAMGVQPA